MLSELAIDWQSTYCFCSHGVYVSHTTLLLCCRDTILILSVDHSALCLSTVLLLLLEIFALLSFMLLQLVRMLRYQPGGSFYNVIVGQVGCTSNNKDIKYFCSFS